MNLYLSRIATILSIMKALIALTLLTLASTASASSDRRALWLTVSDGTERIQAVFVEQNTCEVVADAMNGQMRERGANVLFT